MTNPGDREEFWDRMKREREDEIASGRRCTECDGCIVFGSGGPQRCRGCEVMATGRGEVSHSRRVRCPACGHREPPHGDDCYELYREQDEGEWECGACTHAYSVRVAVDYTFYSPARAEGGEGG